MEYVWNAVSTNGSSLDLLLFLAASAVKATLLLGVVALLCLALNRTSAAVRHMLWALSLCAALLFPLLSVFKVWEVPVLPAQVSSPAALRTENLSRAGEGAFPLTESSRSETAKSTREVDARLPSASEVSAPVKLEEETLPAGGLTEIKQAESRATLFSSVANWALAFWFAGVLLLLFRLLFGYASTTLLKRRAAEFKDPALIELFSSLRTRLRLKSKVRLLRSHSTAMPIVCGVRRPAVLLPAGAEDWSEERKAMVLLHELKHVSRRDCLTQLLAQAACAIYWFNPLVWYAARRLRVEREQACDDYVLSIGAKPSDYAHHLLELARSLRPRRALEWSQTSTVAMARRSQLEGRLLAILSKEGKRRAIPQVMAAGVASLMCALFLALALVQPTTGHARSWHLSKTDVSAKASSGAFLNAYPERESAATNRDLAPEGSNQVQEENSNSGEEAREKSSVGEPAGSELEQYSKDEALRDVEKEVAVDAAHETENVPMPGVLPTLNPFVKIPQRQESETGKQNKSGDFIDEMASVGYTNLSVDDLIRLKSSGVTADFVRSLAAVGFSHLTTRELTSFANNGVAPAYIRELRAAGYNDLSTAELLSFRNNGVTADYIKSLRDAGYSNLPARQLISFAANNVTASYISSIRAAGYGNLSASEIVSIRANGITPEFIRKARSRLGDLTLRQIISLKNSDILDDDVDKDNE